jgi:integrase
MVDAQPASRRRTGKRGNGEGTIYFQKARERWVAMVSLADGKRKALYGRTRQEVAQKLHQAVQARHKGALVTGPRQTVAQFLERWLADSVRPTTRPRTFETYSQKVRLHVVPEIGNVALVSLTPQHLQKLYAQKLESGLAPATVNLIHVVLHRSLKQAKRWGLVGRNVAEDVDAPPRSRLDGSDRAFTASQVAQLLSAMRGHRYEPLWRILLATGVRFGEAAALRWEDVDLDLRTIAIRRTLIRIDGGLQFSPPKTARGRRVIPLPVAAVDTLRAHRERQELDRELEPERWQDLDLVFPNSVGKPLREPAVLSSLHQVLDRAGLPRRRLHDLRHTYATRLFANNAHVRAVQELMGHSRSDMTLEIYASSVPEVLRSAADSLNDLFVDRSKV